MGPADLLAVVMLAALVLYAVLGGADFGAGVWEFTTALQSNEAERRHLYSAIGPVWEANHVWLIFVLVILMNGFPLAFAAISRALWFPLLLALAGIVCRGAGFAFRSYAGGSLRERKTWEAVFALASTATPLFLGASVGAIASGDLIIALDGRYNADYLTGWMSPLTVFTGFYAVVACAYLAAIYLTREAYLAGDQSMTAVWRQRSLSTGVWMGLLSFAGLCLVWMVSPQLSEGFLLRGWPMVAISAACGVGSLVEVYRLHCGRAVIAAAGAVGGVVAGWGVSQYPAIVPPLITSDVARAPDQVLWMMLVVIGIGAVLLFPALGYLMYVFKNNPRT